MNDNHRLSEAIQYAVECHRGGVRKGTTQAYILHPLEVMQILFTMGADTDLMMAGVLHDTVEDTEATPEEIERRFGERVAALVAGHTEDKSLTWHERKRHTIEGLAAERDHRLLVLADKIANLRSMARDLPTFGDRLWDRFRQPKDQQAWYHLGIRDALAELAADPGASEAFHEFDRLCRRIFEDQTEL